MTDKPSAALKIGLTTRVVEAVGYSESRDALAADWSTFLDEAVPEISWIQLPNIGNKIVEYVNEWGLNGFILTGGNDIGEAEHKDQTDLALLDHSIKNQLPVLGICRGLQLMQAHFGGQLRRCPADVHVANHHPVRFNDAFELSDLRNTEHQVNSFHNFGIRTEDVPAQLVPTATTDDGWVEAARIRDSRVTATMWHPERNSHVENLDRQIIRHTFGLDTERIDTN